ncbi:MAG: TetR/AcrR family transcriptional regulator [Prevotella sp.]|nr:TetR/AcrR family transcriptional regulator [Prevotella sp.]
MSLKERILETAMTAFAQYGIRAVKMDDIASGLSISKRTLYEIYGDKESLLLACVKKKHEEKLQYMTEFANNHNVIEVVAEAYRRKVAETNRVNFLFYLDIQQYPQVMRLLEENHASLHESFMLFLSRGVKEGYFRKEVNYELISYMFDVIGESVAKNKLFMRYPSEELLNNLMLVPFRGFCTEKGLKVLSCIKL